MLLEQTELASVPRQQRAEGAAASPGGAQPVPLHCHKASTFLGPVWNKKTKFLSRKRLAAQRDKECSC